MAEPDTVLMTVHGKDGAPSLEAAAQELGIATDALNAAFGVVPIDPGKGLYCVEVQAGRLPADAGSPPYEGPYSNPRIEPFGPSEREDPSNE